MQSIKEGGYWINLGPLNYKKTLRLKLSWEEIRGLWEHMGYEFLQTSQVGLGFEVLEMIGMWVHMGGEDLQISQVAAACNLAL